MGIRTIDQCLVGEAQLWRPVDGRAARELIPLLIDYPGGWITPTGDKQLTWNIGEVLLIFRPAQTADQLKVAEDVVIDLAERRVRIERVGILAEEIIVPLVIEMFEIVGVH